MAAKKFFLLMCFSSIVSVYAMDVTEGGLDVVNTQSIDIKKEVREFWKLINQRIMGTTESLSIPAASPEIQTVPNAAASIETTIKITTPDITAQPVIYWLSKEKALKYGIASAALVIAIGSVTYFFYKQGVLQKIGDSIKKYPYVSASMFSALVFSILALKLSANNKNYLFGLTSGLALGCAANAAKDLAKDFELLKLKIS